MVNEKFYNGSSAVCRFTVSLAYNA